MITIRVTRTRDVLSLVIGFQPGASLGILNGLALVWPALNNSATF